MEDYCSQVWRDPRTIARTQANDRVVRESLLMGPRGGVKVESVWEGNTLVTLKLLGGGR